MIWNTQHINPQQDLYSYYQEREQKKLQPHGDNTIAIVGGGPKGLYGLNHFINRMRLHQATKPCKVLWFNRDELFGCGPNYSILQPDYLLINYCIGHLNAFHDKYSQKEDQQSFMEWLSKVKCIDTDVQPTDFASRALVGYYLQWVAKETMRQLPANVQLQLIAEPVVAIAEQHSKARIETKTGSWDVASILLATGHCYNNTPLITESEVTMANFIRSPYPVSKYDDITSDAQVGITGMGLTFIDIALALTEGRGGTFDDNGEYCPSGKEPLIYSFSRTSLPILCRGPQYQEKRSLYLLNASKFKLWMQQSTKIDFEKDMLPIIEQEIQLRYYAVQFNENDLERLQSLINAIPLQQRFTLHKLLKPNLTNEKEILRYIESNIEEAQQGEQNSPLMAAASVWSEICPYIAELYSSVGFTGNSQQQLDQYYFGAFNRVSYGPPIANMEKILALARAGIIRFLPLKKPTIRWQEVGSVFVVCDENGKATSFNTLIDARIGRPSLHQHNAALYDTLLSQGLICPHRNESYFPGTLSMDQRGKCNTLAKVPIYCYGANTEGVFFDNDTLSRTKNDTSCYWVDDTIRTL